MKTVTPLAELAEQARGVPVELAQHVSSILVTDVEDAPSPPTQTNCCRFHVFFGGVGVGIGEILGWYHPVGCPAYDQCKKLKKHLWAKLFRREKIEFDAFLLKLVLSHIMWRETRWLSTELGSTQQTQNHCVETLVQRTGLVTDLTSTIITTG